jgi:methylmalonyl-CoA mutase
MRKNTALPATLWRGCESDWRAVVKSALGGTSPESLATRSDDGIALGPIFGRPQSSRSVRGRDSRRAWTVVQRAEDPDPGRALCSVDADLAGGAGGIELVLAGSAAADRGGFGMSGLDPQLLGKLTGHGDVQVRLDGGPAAYKFYPQLKTHGLRALTLSFDPLAEAAARGGFDCPDFVPEDSLLDVVLDFSDSGVVGSPLVADGRVWAAGGASEAQEVAAIIGSLAHSARVLVDGGLGPAQALGSIGLVADAGANQLLTIAKLRALRLCHARIVEAFSEKPVRARLHAETSWRMMTRDDVYTNILRATSAALAAGIAGADSITILPCTAAAGLPDLFARRVARNTQTILIEESGLAVVDDPGSGSGAIEFLTVSIAEKAWEIFRRLEAVGGLAEAMRRGTFQSEIADTASSRARRIADRSHAITGISKFPHIDDADAGVVAPRPVVATALNACAEPIERVRAARFAEPFEALRDRASTLARRGKVPRVFLANLGNSAEFADAAQAAANLFAAGGIAAVGSEGLDSPAEAVRSFASADARFACINGSKERLEEQAAHTARALKENGAVRVYVMNGLSADANVDAVLDEGVDIVAVLSEILTLSETAHDA